MWRMGYRDIRCLDVEKEARWNLSSSVITARRRSIHSTFRWPKAVVAMQLMPASVSRDS